MVPPYAPSLGGGMSGAKRAGAAHVGDGGEPWVLPMARLTEPLAR
jgi:hypothetical protein